MSRIPRPSHSVPFLPSLDPTLVLDNARILKGMSPNELPLIFLNEFLCESELILLDLHADASENALASKLLLVEWLNRNFQILNLTLKIFNNMLYLLRRKFSVLWGSRSQNLPIIFHLYH